MTADQIRFWFDFFSAIILFLTAIIGAYLPRYLSQTNGVPISSARSTAFHLGNMLSAGVMLSAGFCHLLADSLHTLAFVGKRFPMANFLAAVGYIITLLADQIVQCITVDQQPAATPASHNHHHMELAIHGDQASNGLEGLLTNPMRRDASANNINGHHKPTDDEEVAKLPLLKREEAKADECHAGVSVLLGHKPLSFATAVLLASALCIHSILEGMALGAQTSMKSTEDIMIAIAAHKGLAAYALGASVVESRANGPKFWTVIGLFSMATPVGIFMGYGLSHNSNNKGGAAMSALASGTFLYVAMMEVIPKELADPKLRIWKMVMLLIGFGLMSLLAIWA